MQDTARKTTVVLLLCLVLLLLPVSGIRAQADPHSGEIDAFIRERMESLDIPGAALAVVRGDRAPQTLAIAYLKGYGVANKAGDPVTPQTPFLLASLSKSMTAVAVMQLVEEGKLALDDPIQAYLPWFMSGTPITVRQLLYQTSGLDEGQGYRRNLDRDVPDALEQSIRRLAAADLNHAPGAAFEYSNSNYDVLGLLVETVSGRPYGEYVQANLFEPLAMAHAFTSLEAARAGGLIRPFYPFFGQPTDMAAILPYSRATQPSAGLFGSAEDMAHYLIMHLNDGRFRDNQILTPAGMEMLHTPGVAIDESGVGYAMGWAVWPFDDAVQPGSDAPIALSHGGEWLGFNHMMIIVPEQDMGMVMLFNTSDTEMNSAYTNIAFDVALLALGQDAQNYPLEEDWMTRHLRLLGMVLILALLTGVWVTLRRLRSGTFSRRDGLLFIALAIFELLLVSYLLFIRLPNNESNLPLVLRFEPDLGLMLVIILLLTIGWGSVRSLWAARLWQAGKRRKL
jgi:CubicO group peptidase (beta-lactamase class C family)